ncbi:MAG: hypothetical protein R2861_07650 [Desulfobacterales bacterium]
MFRRSRLMEDCNAAFACFCAVIFNGGHDPLVPLSDIETDNDMFEGALFVLHFTFIFSGGCAAHFATLGVKPPDALQVILVNQIRQPFFVVQFVFVYFVNSINFSLTSDINMLSSMRTSAARAVVVKDVPIADLAVLKGHPQLLQLIIVQFGLCGTGFRGRLNGQPTTRKYP